MKKRERCSPRVPAAVIYSCSRTANPPRASTCARRSSSTTLRPGKWPAMKGLWLFGPGGLPLSSDTQITEVTPRDLVRWGR